MKYGCTLRTAPILQCSICSCSPNFAPSPALYPLSLLATKVMSPIYCSTNEVRLNFQKSKEDFRLTSYENKGSRATKDCYTLVVKCLVS